MASGKDVIADITKFGYNSETGTFKAGGVEYELDKSKIDALTAGEAGPAPEWKKWTIADAGTIKDIAEGAKKLAEGMSTASDFATTAMKIVKVISELQSANPFLKALEILADETIKAIQDLKNAGYFYLYVDPYWKKNVQTKNIKTYGFEILRDQSGRELYWNPTVNNAEGTTTYKANVRNRAMDSGGGSFRDYEPKLAMPRKLVAGGWNPYFRGDFDDPDPFLKMTPFPQYSATQVLETMAEALNDEGDVPRYKTNQLSGPPLINPAKGEIVYDADGEPFSDWDPKVKEYGLALYNVGPSHPLYQGKPDVNYKDDRVQLNSCMWSGRPNLKGSKLSGVSSSAIVMLIAAPSYQVFVESFFAFSKLFEEIPEFMESVGGTIMDAYNEWGNPATQLLNLTMCDSKYGLFAVGDVIRGIHFGGLGEIIQVVSKEDTSIVSTVLTTETADMGDTRERSFQKNMNADGRFQDMLVEIKPIPTKEADGVEDWTKNDAVREQAIYGHWGVGKEKQKNYMTKGVETFQLPGPSNLPSEKATQSVRHVEVVEGVRRGTTADEAARREKQPLRVYPKYGTVSSQKLSVPMESIEPNFKSIQVGELVPMWNEFFENIENFVVMVKGYTATSSKFIQDIIDVLQGLIADLEKMIATIEKFLKFFEVDLSNAGIYALHIEKQKNGNSGLAAAITGSTGLPSNLGYAAGVLFVGVEVLGFNAIDRLAPILIGSIENKRIAGKLDIGVRGTVSFGGDAGSGGLDYTDSDDLDPHT